MPDHAMDEVVAGVLRERHCPGAVVALSGGGQIATYAVGIADSEGTKPVDAGTWFEIGSITKVFVATMVLQHVARGDIALDDPVHSHVPEFRLADADATNRVTIRHLLTHASGIDAGDDFTDTGTGDDCVEKYVENAVAGSGLLHPVGERWSYCNAGFVVLGRLVERLDGRPWDVALAERILKPCGMGAANRRLVAENGPIAGGHRVDPTTGAVERVSQVMPASIGPSGNVVATAEALVRFAERFFAEDSELLPAALVAEMVSPQIGVREMSQGLGWALATAPVLIASHGGSTLGFTAFLGAVPSVGSALAVVANGPGAGAIALAVYAQLSGRPFEAPELTRQGPGPDATALQSVVGRYERRHVVQDIELDAGSLIARTTFEGPAATLLPQPPVARLEPLGDLHFVSRQPFDPDPQHWEFDTPDHEGQPTRLFTQRLHVRAPSP